MYVHGGGLGLGRDWCCTIYGLARRADDLVVNATFAAAGAGEEVRVFRVVAGEVKKLAQDTRAVTGDIDRRIRLLNDEAVAIIENLKTGITQGQEARTGEAAGTRALDVISQFVRQFQPHTDRVGERVESNREPGDSGTSGLATT